MGEEAISLVAEAALAYAELGYAVFPCRPGTKKPHTEHGFKDASSDTDQIMRWWTDCPQANVAIATEGLLVLDVDGKDNPWLADEPEKLLELARAPVQQTPGGGRQFFFRQPEGRHWRCTTGRIARRVDTRADGGYVVVPPSVRPEGGYRWAETMALDCEPADLPEPPRWLSDMLDASAAGAATSAPIVSGMPGGNAIPSGQRNATLASLGGTMRRAGMSQAEIAAALLRANADRCRPPLADREVERIAASVARYEPDQVTVALVEDHWQQDAESARPVRAKPSDPGPFPRHLLDCGGLLAELVAYNDRTAFKRQPILALGASIALVGTVTGRKVRDRFNTRTNVYCLGVCESGGGKERARQVNKETLFRADLPELAGPEGLASHAGLINAVDRQPAVLFQLDEIGRLLKTLGNPNRSPHLFHVATVLMKLFTSSGSVYLGDAYADTKRNKVIYQPHACLYGTTVPKSLYEGLTAENVTDGFLSRMLIFESDDADPPPREATVEPVPESIVEAVVAWGKFKPGGNLSAENPESIVVPCADDAERVLVELEAMAREERREAPESVATLWTRTTEKARKLALIHACSLRHDSPTVEGASARWAADLSVYLTRRMVHIAAEWIAETPFEAKRKRVLREIRGAEGGRMTQMELCRKVRSIPSRERQEIVLSLVEAGDVRIEKEPTSGAPRTVYAACQGLLP